MELSSLVFFTILVAISIGLVAALIYTLRHKMLTLTQWGIAFLAALVWGFGWFIGALSIAEKWDSLFSYINGSNPADLISDIHYSGYYSLAIGPILAALLGTAVLYLLMRYLPSKKAG